MLHMMHSSLKILISRLGASIALRCSSFIKICKTENCSGPIDLLVPKYSVTCGNLQKLAKGKIRQFSIKTFKIVKILLF